MYLVIGLGAAIENVIPPVPADTFVLLGAFLAANGRANPWVVFLVTWICNVASLIAVYAVAWRYGSRFFQTKVGTFLLQPHQLDKVSEFYVRFGVGAILFSRFLPAFRAVVPVFAGISKVSAPRLVIPAAIASAAWYGLLVYIGAAAGRNWQDIMRFFDRFSTILVAVAAVLVAAFLWWWWKSRKSTPDVPRPNLP